MDRNKAISNRIGFILLGLTNNFAYNIMLSAAFDLLSDTEPAPSQNNQTMSIHSVVGNSTDLTSSVHPIDSQQTMIGTEPPFCNQHSTSSVLLADSLPSLTTKLVYPFLLAGLPTTYKATGVAALATASFLITGLSSNRLLIFAGVACASFACGLGETTYLSNAPRYGTVAISGWSTGTGISGLLGSITYAAMRTVLPIKIIMINMLSIPIAMLLSYFYLIEPVEEVDGFQTFATTFGEQKKRIRVSVISGSSEEDQSKPIWPVQRSIQSGPYGVLIATPTTTTTFTNATTTADAISTQVDQQSVTIQTMDQYESDVFNFKKKLRFLPTLVKYFAPLFLVYYAEFFINQGLHELIYYPEITSLDHAAQYRWYQVTYQFGVMVSRASLDFLVIRHLWTMSLLQVVNAFIFLGHAAKLFYIPNFYIVIVIIIYEGLLGGFTYANTFYRMREELKPDRQEFSISTVVIADTLGIVLAGSTAIPVHDSLCKLYA